MAINKTTFEMMMEGKCMLHLSPGDCFQDFGGCKFSRNVIYRAKNKVREEIIDEIN